MQKLLKLSLAIFTVIFLIAAPAIANPSANPQACDYTFEEAQAMLMDYHVNVTIHELTGEQLATLRSRQLNNISCAAWFEAPGVPTVYLLYEINGCARAGGEMLRATLNILINRQ